MRPGAQCHRPRSPIADYALAREIKKSAEKGPRLAGLPGDGAGKRRNAGRGRLRYFLACAVDVSAVAIVL
jgi:hypothetical protein